MSNILSFDDLGYIIVAYLPSTGKYNLMTYAFDFDQIKVYPFSTINADLNSFFAMKQINGDRMVAAGSFSTFTKADSSSLGFSFKLGTIYDINTGSSPDTCDGLSQPIYSFSGAIATYNGGKVAGVSTTFNLLALTISSTT